MSPARSPRRTTFWRLPGWNPVSAAQRCRHSKLTPISPAEPKADIGEYEIPAGRQLPAALAALEVLRGVRPPQLQVAHEGVRNREGLLVLLEEPAGGRPEPRCVVSLEDPVQELQIERREGPGRLQQLLQTSGEGGPAEALYAVSYTHLRAHE